VYIDSPRVIRLLHPALKCCRAVARSISGTDRLSAHSHSPGAAGACDESAEVSESPSSDQIQFFETAIRPLLATTAIDCKRRNQEGELRLDCFEGSGRWESVPCRGQTEQQPVRCVSMDSELRMPAHENLSIGKIADLTRWSKSGLARNRAQVKLSRAADVDNGSRSTLGFSPDSSPGRTGSAAFQCRIDRLVRRADWTTHWCPLRRADNRKLIRCAFFRLIWPSALREIRRSCANAPKMLRARRDRFSNRPLR